MSRVFLPFRASSLWLPKFSLVFFRFALRIIPLPLLPSRVYAALACLLTCYNFDFCQITCPPLSGERFDEANECA